MADQPHPMRVLMDDVARFHLMSGQPVADSPSCAAARVFLRRRLLAEEHTETQDALEEQDLPAIADGLADLIYVCIGTALEFGIPLDRVWSEVQCSNMAKAGPDGKCQFREDGKLLKPEGWTPPDINKALYG